MNKGRGLWRGKGAYTSLMKKGEWIIGYYCDARRFTAFEDEQIIINSENEQGASYVIDPSTLGECVGIPDKNDKLIFEGDILKNEYGEVFQVYWSWICARFILTDELYNARKDFSCSDEFEIIGNIHDNPELLRNKTGEDVSNDV